MAISKVTIDGKEMLEYRFRTKLEDGTLVGGEQVVRAETQDELMDKAAENYNQLWRHSREEKLKREMAAPAPEGAKTAPPTFIPKPRPLTAEERMRFTRDIVNPATADEALDLAIEAKLGAKSAEISQSLARNDKNASAIRAAQESTLWAEAHPEVIFSANNRRDLATWIAKHNLEFTVENYDLALQTLAPDLEQMPTSSEGTPTKPLVDTPPSRIAGEGDGSEQRQPKVLPTSPSRRTGTTKGETKQTGKMTVEQFRRLPNEERRKLMRENPDILK